MDRRLFNRVALGEYTRLAQAPFRRRERFVPKALTTRTFEVFEGGAQTILEAEQEGADRLDIYPFAHGVGAPTRGSTRKLSLPSSPTSKWTRPPF